MVASPLRGSGRADFPHRHLPKVMTSGRLRGGMTDARRRQSAVDEPPHPVPEHAAVLAATRQCAMPEAPDLEPKPMERRLVHGHPIGTSLSTNHQAQSRDHCGDEVLHAPLGLGFYLVILIASAPRSEVLSRQNTRPVGVPVNASTPPSQAAPHDSDSVWLATPSPDDSFIHYTSPV